MSKNQRGFALVVVLWIVALLALAATAFTHSVQSHVREVGAMVRHASAVAMAEAGARLVVYELSADAHLGTRFPADGSPFACRFADAGILQISVVDAASKVNLNLAEASLIASLLAGLGIDGDKAVILADRIVDFRDRDHDPRPQGAEREAYVAAGIHRGPKDGAFDTLLELHQVMGLDAATVAEMTPYITLHSGSGKLDPQETPARLVELLNRGLASLPIADRRSSFFGDRLPAEFASPSPRRFFEASISAWPAAGGTIARRGVFDVQSPANRNAKLVQWSDSIEAPNPRGHGDLPDC